ncbi:sigma-70 family RNA polymerase sigma factor [Tautonia sp. JC769]|uniref:sigma-70 family RNA polymerase sigma factor n=1 Tax=Tautonia sp. JC769 TaxID=3232135 RepID=UPI00345A1B4E
MPKPLRGDSLKLLRILFNLGTIGELTDGQLLQRFLDREGESAELAFAALVERHGPMVLRTCRAVLRDGHEAEDAFQATFQILARKARGLWVRDSLGPWLHAVAIRSARHARSEAARRRRAETRAARSVAWASVDAGGPEGLGEALHEELGRLPERYRAAVVLCCLEGLSLSQAAQRLGWPQGTVQSRLARGRQRLRERLARRGLAPSVGAFGAALASERAQAAVPVALAEAATRAAMSVTAGKVAAAGAVPAAVLLLTEGVLRAMIYAKIRMLAIAGLTAAGLATGITVLAQAERDGTDVRVSRVHEPRKGPSRVESPRVDPQGDAGDRPVHEVRSGPLTATAVGRGNLESANNLEVRSEVEGQVTITMILPEGTKVVKDQLVCELDATTLKNDLANQQIATERAQADSQNAIKTREMAEVEVQCFKEGTFPHEEMSLQGDIELAVAELELARERLEAIKDHPEQALGLVSVKEGEVAVLRANLALKKAERALEVLRKFTYGLRITSLEGAVETAKADELAKMSAFTLEKEKEEKLRRMIEKCRIFAPGNGIVIYHQEEGRFGSQEGPSIKEGATVRERQMIFKLPDIDNMRVDAKLPESMIAQVRPGMPARIRVDAFPNSLLSGEVVEIKPLPDPKLFFSDQDVAVYTVFIEIEEGHEGLRPGLTASVEVIVADLDDVICVPVRALLHDGGKDHVAVKTPEGAIEWREVTVGVSDGETVEITQGLRVGEQVMLDPIGLLSEEEVRARGLDHPAPPAGAESP